MPDITISKMSEVLEQSIALEEGIRDLYHLFANSYPEERTYWLRLAKDEQHHADILEGLRPWVAMGTDVDQFLLPDIQELKEKNLAIKHAITMAGEEHPTRAIAFNLAHKIELTASELHYQKIITQTTDNKLLASMQELCGADKDHLKRIKKMMKTLKIEVIEN